MSEDPFTPRPISRPPTASGVPAARTGRGPVALLVIGGVTLVLAVVAAIGTARLFAGALPLGVLTADGTAGPDVVAEASVPGTTTVTLAEGTTYTLLLRTEGTGSADLAGDLSVAGPGGADLPVGSADVSTSTARGGAYARSVAGITARSTGEHVVTAPPVDGGVAASLLVVESAGFGPFIGSIFGTVAGAFAALLLGAVGLGLLVGGLIWRHVRRRGPTAPAPPAP